MREEVLLLSRYIPSEGVKITRLVKILHQKGYTVSQFELEQILLEDGYNIVRGRVKGRIPFRIMS